MAYLDYCICEGEAGCVGGHSWVHNRHSGWVLGGHPILATHASDFTISIKNLRCKLKSTICIPFIYYLDPRLTKWPSIKVKD